jgi:hypothetical protein
VTPDDDQARKKRADDLRSSIREKERGEKRVGVPTPREITDEAARKLRDNVDSSSTPNIDPKEK